MSENESLLGGWLDEIKDFGGALGDAWIDKEFSDDPPPASTNTDKTTPYTENGQQAGVPQSVFNPLHFNPFGKNGMSDGMKLALVLGGGFVAGVVIYKTVIA